MVLGYFKNEWNKKLTVSFFKLSNYNINYQHSIEKELLVTQDK